MRNLKSHRKVLLTGFARIVNLSFNVAASAEKSASISKGLKIMELTSSHSWLNQVQVITRSPATNQALETLNNAAKPNELAVAEEELIAALLTDIAAELAQ
jgi:hypothetical protein